MEKIAIAVIHRPWLTPIQGKISMGKSIMLKSPGAIASPRLLNMASPSRWRVFRVESGTIIVLLMR